MKNIVTGAQIRALLGTEFPGMFEPGKTYEATMTWVEKEGGGLDKLSLMMQNLDSPIRGNVAQGNKLIDCPDKPEECSWKRS